jgi:hypothetical protein
MSRPTLPPPRAGFSPDEIAAQVAAFEAKGGKIQQKTEGETGVGQKDMQAIQDMQWRKAAEARKEAGIKDESIKGKRK